MEDHTSMNRILVTGGSGFVGRHLIRGLLDTYPQTEIISISRGECAIGQLLAFCPSPRLRIVIGDIRDTKAISYATKGVDAVIHLAAMKRVELSEAHSCEAASINVLGTLNVLDAFPGNTFIFMSTDKAVEPVNCYGATKLIAERLTCERAHKATDGARFMIVRSANITGSTGSVLDIWRHQIEERNEITVTDLRMMRFYTTIEGVVRLCIAMLEKGENGKVYITPQGEPRVLGDLVKETIQLYGNERTKTRIVGPRPGEKMQEKMWREEERNVVAGFVPCIEDTTSAGVQFSKKEALA